MIDQVRLVASDPRVIPIAQMVAERDDVPDLVDEVKQALSSGSAYLFAFRAGFFILQPYVNERLENVVNVLLAHGKGGFSVKTYLPVIVQLAQTIGAVKLSSYTRHDRVGRVLERYGFMNAGRNAEGLIFYEMCLGCSNGERS
ncbi:hypothetical protein K6U20_11725 [Vibrio fluvialis]|uniref:hypothetical protein n=1 Tax=Vibrio fluvialis TaxID=676 RepID=UPI001EEAF058|nr:hypothetical protein [Vibrio fluvialis]MCG6405291.1 hypothetical protein [Vibrio fluvialis]